MSDNWITIIPEDPHFVSDEVARQKAVSYFRSIAPAADEVTSSVSDRVQFVDCGCNFESVACPACGMGIEIKEWQDWMDGDYDGKEFELKPHVMPCCGARQTLHELQYKMPQGFGRFELSAMNPGIAGLSDDDRKCLEDILGCRVRVIWRRL